MAGSEAGIWDSIVWTGGRAGEQAGRQDDRPVDSRYGMLMLIQSKALPASCMISFLRPHYFLLWLFSRLVVMLRGVQLGR